PTDVDEAATEPLLQEDRAVGHDEAGAADGDLVAGDADLDPARPAQGAALPDDDRALGGRAVTDEQRSQRSGGGSGSGILGDPHDGIEEPAVRDGVVVSGLEAVEGGALAARMRK